MTAIVDELNALMALATRLNRTPGVSRCDPEHWHIERDDIAHAIARTVGRLRQELGIKAPLAERRFCAAQRDDGARFVESGGRRVPIERR